MANTSIDNIRNIALVGHGASGKTTLADLMLFKSGVGSRAGSVDDGTSQLDTDDEEKQRKNSISSSLIHIEAGGKRVNVIDTPGYPDYIGGAIGALGAVETAVVTVNASAGIEVNTRRVFEEAGNAGIARMILVNKCDSDNVDFDGILAQLQDVFGMACQPFNLPVGIGADFSGVVSTLEVPDDVPGNVVGDPADINSSLIESIVEADEELMEKYLEEGEVSPEEVNSCVTKALAAGTLIPVFCASSKTDVGVAEFLEAVARFAPNPTEIARQDAEGNEITQSADGNTIAQVFKTRIDPFVAKLSYIRVYSGKLSKDSSVRNERADKNMKLAQPLEVQGAEQSNVSEVTAGNIFAVAKMDDLNVSDTLTIGCDGTVLAPIDFPSPMVYLAVEPESRADQTKISGALSKVQDEDQTFHIHRDTQTKEMVMQGMSELHLTVIVERLKSRDKVGVLTKQPKIPYRETCQGKAEGSYRHKKQSGGSGQFGEVHFRIGALDRNVDHDEYFTKSNFLSYREHHYNEELNYAFVDSISGGSVPNNFIPAIEKGVVERMEQGCIAGYQVQDVYVELFFGKDHPVDSNETAFKTAASMCFREVFKDANPVLLEPIVDLAVTVPGDKLGDITSDLNTRRGRMEGMDGAAGGFQIIRAKIPLAEVMTYSRSLSSMTGGQGSFTFTISHYEMMPPNEASKVIAAAEKEKEEEG